MGAECRIFFGGVRPPVPCLMSSSAAGLEVSDWTKGLVQYEREDVNPDRLRIRPERWGVCLWRPFLGSKEL